MGICRTVVGAAALSAALALSAAGAASPQSRALVERGYRAFEAKAFEAARDDFRAAAAADPLDGEAAFFLGAALNRLALFDAALDELARADALGTKNPDFLFETGWALLQTDHALEARTRLQQYEAAHPGRGQTMEFLGRANLALGRYDEAAEDFRKALERDPSLKPTVLVYMAGLERARGNREAALADLGTLLRETPEAPLAQTLREQLTPAPGPGAKPWHASLSVGAGFNSNVIALGQGVALPSDISSRHSGFARTALAGSYDWRLGAADTLTAGYGFLSDNYFDTSAFDLRDHFPYLDYRHSFAPDLTGALRLSDEFSQIGGQDFRNQVGLRPALGYRVREWALLEASYNFAASNYFQPAAAVFNRDGTGHTVALTAYAVPPDTQWLLRAGYFHQWNRTSGSDFNYDSNGLFVGVAHPLFWSIVADAQYSHSFDGYRNLNSLAGPAGFGFRRSDDGDVVNFRLVRPITEWLSAYANYDFVHNNSNIGFYTYEQHALIFGLTASF